MSVFAREGARVGSNLAVTFAFLIPMVMWPAGGRVVGMFGPQNSWFRSGKHQFGVIHENFAPHPFESRGAGAENNATRRKVRGV